LKIYIAPFQDPYSEVLPTQAKQKRIVFRRWWNWEQAPFGHIQYKIWVYTIYTILLHAVHHQMTRRVTTGRLTCARRTQSRDCCSGSTLHWKLLWCS